MRVVSVRLLVCLCLLVAAGCETSETSPASSTSPGLDSSSGTAGGSANPASQATAGPKAIVHQYLTAVRDGDESRITSLLTAAARRKTSELNIAVAPPASPNAEFDVRDVEYLDDSKTSAHVASQWRELNVDGRTQAIDILWVMRQEGGAWRVAGMIARLFEGHPPTVFDFEDPEEVIRRQEQARAESQRRGGLPSSSQPRQTRSSDQGTAPSLR